MASVDLTGRLPRILRALHDQGWMGITQFRVWRQLKDYLSGSPEVFEYAPAYWTITSNALFDQSLLSIARLLDTHRDAASVEYLLNLVESGVKCFEKKGRKKAAVLAQVAKDRTLLAQLRQKEAPVRRKRNEVLAHLGRTSAADLNELASMFPVDPALVEGVFEDLSRLVNTYSVLWDDRETHWDLIGGDDFKGLGRLLTLGKNTEDDERERRFGRPRRRRVDPSGRR